MINPFESDEHGFLVLVNEEGQHSLWPEHLDIPAGWERRGPQGDRATCLAWIEANWTDMRPLSLVCEMERQAVARPPQD